MTDLSELGIEPAEAIEAERSEVPGGVRLPPVHIDAVSEKGVSLLEARRNYWATTRALEAARKAEREALIAQARALEAMTAARNSLRASAEETADAEDEAARVAQAKEEQP